MQAGTFSHTIRALLAALLLSGGMSAASADAPVAEEGRVLVFWASWCTYCKQALKTVDELQRDNKLAGYQAVAVNIPNDRSDPERYLQQLGVDLPSAELDNIRDAASGVIGVPWVVMIDRDGQVIAGKRAPRSEAQFVGWVGEMDRVYQQLSLLK